MFSIATSVRLYDTDAAGLLFFGSCFRIVHDAYEAFMESIGLNVSRVVRESAYLLPIVHAEADYLSPLGAGDRIRVSVEVERIGKTSFTVSYTIRKSGRIAAKARTVHVAVNRKRGTKIPLPADLRRRLSRRNRAIGL